MAYLELLPGAARNLTSNVQRPNQIVGLLKNADII
jgi:hypothetical protein